MPWQVDRVDSVDSVDSVDKLRGDWIGQRRVNLDRGVRGALAVAGERSLGKCDTLPRGEAHLDPWRQLMKPEYWLAMILAAWMPMVGCGGDEADADEGDDEGDEGEDTSEKDDEEEEEMALVSFCNPLVYNNEDVVMQAIIGEGDDELVLEAITGTCSNQLGDPCEEIEPGEEIPVVVVDEFENEQLSTTIDIEAGKEYVLSTNFDQENNVVVLDHGYLSDNLECENMECHRFMVNKRTCASDDPCGWGGNQECEVFCSESGDCS